PIFAIVHQCDDEARSFRSVFSRDRDGFIRNDMAHEELVLAIPSRWANVFLVIAASLLHQRIPALDDSSPSPANGNLSIGSEEIGILLWCAEIMNYPVKVHQFSYCKTVECFGAIGVCRS